MADDSDSVTRVGGLNNILTYLAMILSIVALTIAVMANMKANDHIHVPPTASPDAGADVEPLEEEDPLMQGTGQPPTQ